MMIVGLTGGIGMGKSTAAAALRRDHVPVFDADAVVRRLQAPHGRALPALAAAFPDCVHDGVLNRAALRTRVLHDDAAMRCLEVIMHPLVNGAERQFLARARRTGRRMVVLDIPLLFETGAQRRMHRIITVSAPPRVQGARLRARGLPADQIAALIARQMPDAEKRRRADVVIQTGLSRAHGLRRLRRFLHVLSQEMMR